MKKYRGVFLKNEREIGLLREANRMVAMILDELGRQVRPGLPTMHFEEIVQNMCREFKVKPAFQGMYGFPYGLCCSVNEVIVHGFPSEDVILKEGDIVSLDAGVIYKGYHSDAARTHGVGTISEDAKNLIAVTRQSFFEGIKQAREGNHLYDISAAIDDYVSQFGYGIVHDLVGHGIGTSLHEDPQIPNFRQKRRGVRLQAGMTLAVEPMINIGDWPVEWMDDGWTVVTKDGSLSAHYENTILITDGEPEILTIC